MLTSRFDLRSYDSFTLPCGIQVLTVQDQNLHEASVSASIKAGHFDDPKDCQGLAHLLEHMLFLGNAAFAKPNEFADFLSGYGGNVNAWTGTEYSNFHFNVDSGQLKASLAHFAAMLSTPLFRSHDIESEIKTIEAEFTSKLKDDLRRLYQVHKETCNPAHPFSQFSVGNQCTLGSGTIEQLRARLMSQHSQLFVGANIALCIISQLPSSLIKAQLNSAFASFPTGAAKPNVQLPDLYLTEQLGTFIYIEPLKSARRLIVTFALPNMDKHYRSKPLSLLSHMLGDEGRGSMLAYLKTLGLATSLSAGGGIKGSNFKDFNINLQLTEKGQNQVDQVLACIFSYLKLIKLEGLAKWRFDEKQRLSQLAFDYSDKVKPAEEACSLAERMFRYPHKHLLATDFIMDVYQPDLLAEVLSHFSPQNMRVKLISHGHDYDQKAQWYQTPYSLRALTKEQLIRLEQAELLDELSLPEPNSYIREPRDNKAGDELNESNQSKQHLPLTISAEPHSRFYFAHDSELSRAKGDIYLSFDFNRMTEGAEFSSHLRLWVALLQEKLTTDYYHAGIAGLNFHLYPHQGGMSLNTSGFAHKQAQLNLDILGKIFEAKTAKADFARIKNKILISLQNTLLNKPINKLFSQLASVLQKYTFTSNQLLDHTHTISLQSLDNFQHSLFNEYYLEGLMCGDWQQAQAEDFWQNIHKQAFGKHKPNGAPLKREVLKLDKSGKCLLIECQHQESALVKYLQAPDASLHSVALCIVIEQLLSAPFFNRMRNEKQLGYVAGSGYVPMNQYPGIAIYAQSPFADVKTLLAEFECFLHDFAQDISKQTDLLERVKQSVAKQLIEPERSLSGRAQRYWLAIGNQDITFDRQKRLAEHIFTLEIDEISQYLAAWLNHTFGQINLYTDGKHALLKPNDKHFEDIDSFKRSANYFE